MSEKNVVAIKGQVFNLPPFTAGQMRRQVDPVLQATRDILTRAQALQEGNPNNEDVLDLTMLQRDLARQQADLVLGALQNQYPHVTLDDVETLTPARISQVFNELHQLTIQGSNEPGETVPQTVPKKRR